MIENKFIYTIINIIMGILNIIILMPLVLAVGLIIVALCLVNVGLFIAFILAILKIFIPSLPVNFGIDNIILRIIIVFILAIMSYYLYEFLNLYIPQYLSFLGVYMKKSFKFKFKI